MQKCPKCGHENPDEALFCEECDWRVDIPYVPEKKRNPLHFAILTCVLGIVGAVCAFISGAGAVAILFGALALVLGGYSINVARILAADKVCTVLSGVGLILGVIGFVVGLAVFVGAM